MWGFAIIVSFLADQAISKNFLRTGIVRRISNTIAHSGTAFCLIGICFTGCNQTATIVLLTLAITMQGALYSGFFTNPLDIAPNFAGTILGITNAIGTIPGWLAPLLAGAFTKEKVRCVKSSLTKILWLSIGHMGGGRKGGGSTYLVPGFQLWTTQ